MIFDADKFLKVAVGLGILTAGLGVGYHYGVYLPESERLRVERSNNEHRERQEFLQAQARDRKQKYDACMEQSMNSYQESWANDCKKNGDNRKARDCSLPTENADNWNEMLKVDQKRCLDEFKLGA